MPLIVEDGTSKIDADSYMSVSEADVYHSDRGMAIWGNLSPTEKEQALRRATEYMIGEYRTRWSGYRASALQSLDWPRTDVVLDDMGATRSNRLYPSNAIPSEVKKACGQLALKASQGELVEDTGPQIIEDTIGPITTKFALSTSAPRTKYLMVDNLLKAYLASGDSPYMVKLIRT